MARFKKTDPSSIAHVERVAKAIAMRKEGKQYDEIARELGWNSPQACHKVVKKALEKTVILEASELKRVMFSRLESAVVRLMETINRTDSNEYEVGIIERLEYALQSGDDDEVSRLSILLEKINDARSGSVNDSIDRLVKISDRYAKLFGLDSPVKIAETDADGRDVPRGAVTFYLPDNGRNAPDPAKK